MELPNASPAPDPLTTSARGWQRLQLAALGLIGICGVLWATGDRTGPAWLQWLAAGLAVLSLALACVAIYLVGTIAYPLRGPDRPAAGAHRLRAGVWLTYVAVAILVVGTLSGWWPHTGEDAELVEVRDRSGTTWCGELGTGPPGTIRLDTPDGPVAIALETLATLTPTSDCD